MSAATPLDPRSDQPARWALEQRAKRTFTEEEWEESRDLLLKLFSLLATWDQATRKLER